MIIKHLCKRWFLVLGLLVFFCAGSMVYGGAAEDGKLFQSIKKANTSDLQEAIKAGANVDLADPNGMTVLMMASAFGQTETVKALIANKAKLDLQDGNGNTALLTACKNKRDDIVKILVEKGTDINIQNKNGDTVLSLALSHKANELAKYLLKSKAYIKVTPSLLTAGIGSGDPEICDMIKALSSEVKPGNAEEKLSSLRISELKLKNTSLTEVVIKLRELAREADPDRQGIKFIYEFPPSDKKLRIPDLTIDLENVTIEKALQHICQSTGMKYRIEQNIVMIYEFEEVKKDAPEVEKTAWDNLRPFKTENNKYGYANIATGKTVIAPIFDGARRSWDGKLAAAAANGKWGVIDSSGKFTVKPKFDELWGFSSDHTALAKLNGKWGLINESGDFVIESKFEKLLHHRDGIAAAKTGGKWGFVDKNGKFLIEPKFGEVYDFNEGIAGVSIKGKWGFIDKSGKFIIQPRFEKAWTFFNNVAPVKLNGKYGYIDKSGNFVIEPQFEMVYPFWDHQYLAAACIDKKWGIIDNTGKFIVRPAYDHACGMSDGLVSVMVGRKWGSIDMTGEFVIEPQFDDAPYFIRGTAEVELGKKMIKIDKRGTIITPIYFPGKGSSVMFSRTAYLLYIIPTLAAAAGIVFFVSRKKGRKNVRKTYV